MIILPKTNDPLDFPKDLKPTPEGLLGIGGNLNPLTLINAYAKGVFPWFSENNPILWWYPSPRLVIFPEFVHFSRVLLKKMKKISLPSCPLPDDKPQNAPYKITLNKCFHRVIEECANKRGKKRESTWITKKMQKAYIELHKLEYAHSVEVWNPTNELVGGLYGIAMGKIFFGESMFSHESNTSKYALVWLCDLIQQHGFYLIDCQLPTNHLKSMGATEISIENFESYLKKGKTYLKKPYRFPRTPLTAQRNP